MVNKGKYVNMNKSVNNYVCDKINNLYYRVNLYYIIIIII